MERRSQEYPSDLEQLALMRAFVRDRCQQAWGPDAAAPIAQLELALSEAAANILLHAYQGQPGPPIELVVETDAEQARVALYHGGPGFDPTGVAEPTLDCSRESGYGLYLIRQSVDDFAFVQDEHGRHGVCLTKHR